MKSTIIVTVSPTTISLVCSALIGYALARLRPIGNLGIDHPPSFLSGTALGRHLLSHPLPEGVLRALIKADALFWGSLMSSAVLGSFPIAFLYSFFVKHYASGLKAGAVKG